MPEQSESFEERINLLHEELSFAIEWQRPSILLVFYESGYIQARVELALKKRLAAIGQQMVHFSVDERHFDIARLLSKRPNRDHAIFSVTGLSLGGGKEGANAYRALNIRREYFVDYAMRVIIWLTNEEAVELSRHAPDFWAFRHRVVEFNDSLDHEHSLISADDLTGRSEGFPNQPEDVDQQIELHKTFLTNLPKQTAFSARRLDPLSGLALLYRAKAAYDRSLQSSRRGISTAKQLNDTEALARFWGILGLTYLDLNQLNRAIRAYWKAIRYTPQDAGLWSGLGKAYLVKGRTKAARRVLEEAIKVNPQDASAWIDLGHCYRIEKRVSDAIITYQKAIQVAPRVPFAHLSLAACYRLLGKENIAEEQKNLAQPMIEKGTEFQRAVFESVCGNPGKAIDLLAIALEMNQVRLNWLRCDPNLDFIRDDPRFERLYGQAAPNSREN